MSPSPLVQWTHDLPHLDRTFGSVSSSFQIPSKKLDDLYSESLLTFPVIIAGVSSLPVLVFTLLLICRSIFKYIPNNMSRARDYAIVTAIAGSLALILLHLLFLGDVAFLNNGIKGVQDNLAVLQNAFGLILTRSSSAKTYSILLLQAIQEETNLNSACSRSVNNMKNLTIQLQSTLHSFMNASNELTNRIDDYDSFMNQITHFREITLYTLYGFGMFVLIGLLIGYFLKWKHIMRLSVVSCLLYTYGCISIATILLGATMTTSDFCMDSAGNFANIISNNAALSYYSNCDGINPLNTYAITAQTTNTFITTNITFSTRSGGECAGSIQASTLLSYTTSIDALIQSNSLYNCSYTIDVWDPLLNTYLCENAFIGLFFQVTVLYLIALFYFALSIGAGLIYPYFDLQKEEEVILKRRQTGKFGSVYVPPPSPRESIENGGGDSFEKSRSIRSLDGRNVLEYGGTSSPVVGRSRASSSARGWETGSNGSRGSGRSGSVGSGWRRPPPHIPSPRSSLQASPIGSNQGSRRESRQGSRQGSRTPSIRGDEGSPRGQHLPPEYREYLSNSNPSSGGNSKNNSWRSENKNVIHRNSVEFDDFSRNVRVKKPIRGAEVPVGEDFSRPPIAPPSPRSDKDYRAPPSPRSDRDYRHSSDVREDMHYSRNSDGGGNGTPRSSRGDEYKQPPRRSSQASQHDSQDPNYLAQHSSSRRSYRDVPREWDPRIDAREDVHLSRHSDGGGNGTPRSTRSDEYSQRSQLPRRSSQASQHEEDSNYLAQHSPRRSQRDVPREWTPNAPNIPYSPNLPPSPKLPNYDAREESLPRQSVAALAGQLTGGRAQTPAEFEEWQGQQRKRDKRDSFQHSSAYMNDERDIRHLEYRRPDDERRRGSHRDSRDASSPQQQRQEHHGRNSSMDEWQPRSRGDSFRSDPRDSRIGSGELSHRSGGARDEGRGSRDSSRAGSLRSNEIVGNASDGRPSRSESKLFQELRLQQQLDEKQQYLHQQQQTPIDDRPNKTSNGGYDEQPRIESVASMFISEDPDDWNDAVLRAPAAATRQTSDQSLDRSITQSSDTSLSSRQFMSKLRERGSSESKKAIVAESSSGDIVKSGLPSPGRVDLQPANARQRASFLQAEKSESERRPSSTSTISSTSGVFLDVPPPRPPSGGSLSLGSVAALSQSPSMPSQRIQRVTPPQALSKSTRNDDVKSPREVWGADEVNAVLQYQLAEIFRLYGTALFSPPVTEMKVYNTAEVKSLLQKQLDRHSSMMRAAGGATKPPSNEAMLEYLQELDK